MPSWTLTPRQRCDLELLLTGAFAPLTGFLTQADYENVLSHTRLANGKLWPIPITLDVSDDFADRINLNHTATHANTTHAKNNDTKKD